MNGKLLWGHKYIAVGFYQVDILFPYSIEVARFSGHQITQLIYDAFVKEASRRNWPLPPLHCIRVVHTNQVIVIGYPTIKVCLDLQDSTPTIDFYYRMTENMNRKVSV